MKDSEISALVDEAGALDVECKAKYKRLSDIKRALQDEATARPEAHEEGKKGGKHWIFDGEKHRVTVTFPDPSISLGDEGVNAVKEVVGDDFPKLFERSTVFKPVKGFRELLGALLTKVKARKVLKICEVEASPRVAFAAR